MMSSPRLLSWLFLVAVISACSGNSISTVPGSHLSGVAAEPKLKRDTSSPTPTPAPTAVYTNATPYANWVNANSAATPIAVSYKFASTASFTVIASYKCKANTTGGTIFALPTSWFLEGGTCNGGSNPTTASGTHFYDVVNALQAVPTSSLTAGIPYVIAGTTNGVNIKYLACSPSCVETTANDNNAVGAATSGYIGAAAPNSRVSIGDVWNVQIYNYRLSDAAIQALANGAPPDPFPTVTPNSNAAYSNASPVPEGGALGGTTVGPTYARDSFHIDWDAFCSAAPTHCLNGNPNYVNNDQSMIADTFPTNQYDAGITSVCNGAQSSVSGSTNGSPNNDCEFSVGTYYAKTSDPLVTIKCTIYACGAGPSGNPSPAASLQNAQIYIPLNALPQQSSDGHLSVKQPSGVICQIWLGGSPNQTYSPINSSSLNVGQGACGPSSESTEGSTLLAGGGYAGDDEMSRGFIRPEDIAGSNGDGTDVGDPYAFYHGLYGSFPNNQTGVTWPAIGGDGQCTSSNTINGVMPVEGMVLYLDSAGFAAVKQWNPAVNLRWLKRALGALHRHGMFDLDSSGCTNQSSALYVNTASWGSQSYVLGGGTSPLDAYLTNYIHPYESTYFSAGGSEDAIYTNDSGSAYVFNVLWYKDVPGLSLSNFHWLNRGCAQFAVQGSSNNPC